MSLINTTFYLNGIQNFLVPENNTNSYDNDLIQNSATISEEGIASGFHIAQTTSPSNQVQIRFDPTTASKNGKVGTVIVKTPGNEFLVLSLRSPTALNLDIPENTTSFTRHDLICIHADFRTTGATNFSIRYNDGTTLTDPDLDAWNAANSGQILLPIARIAKTPGSLVSSSQIILSGQTSYNVNKSVRQTAKYLAGSIKVMTLAERNASSWNPADLCMVKAALDANNTLHLNTSTTATPFWKQVALLAQLSAQWVLLLTKALGLTNGTTALAETDGTGSFTLPAGFFSVGTTLEITETIGINGRVFLASSGSLFIQTTNFLINGVNLFSNTLTGNANVFPDKLDFSSSAATTSFTKKTTIQCIAVSSSTATLRISTQNIANATGGSSLIFSTSNNDLPQAIITQNVPMVISTNIVKSGIVSWSTSSNGNTPVNDLTVFTIQKQT